MTARLDRSGWPDARARPPRIVHLGAGNFSRAHQAWYTFAAGSEWGITAFSGRGGAVAEALAEQDGLYTLIERGPDQDRLIVVDAVVAAHSGTDQVALTAAIAAPDTAVVTLTITEAGYSAGRQTGPTGVFCDPRPANAGPPSAAGRQTGLTGVFCDPPRAHSDPPRADTAPPRAHTAPPSAHTAPPSADTAPPRADTAPRRATPALERLTHALCTRRRAGGGPLALVSCDNLHANGEVLRERILAHADAIDPSLTPWLTEHVSFVSTSVDRITPRTTDADRRLVADRLARIDAVPVVTEPFTDWVLAGDFPAGRPPWEDAGARFVTDIDRWERRKLWLLNGGHSLLAYLGLLRGHATVAEAVADLDLRLALEHFWDLAERHLPGADDLDLAHYRNQLIDRFSNARIGYPLTQVGTDGLGKLRNRIVPVVDAALAAGASVDELAPALSVTDAWSRWLAGQRARHVALNDADEARLQAALEDGGAGDPRPALIALLAPHWAANPDLMAALTRLPPPPTKENRL